MSMAWARPVVALRFAVDRWSSIRGDLKLESDLFPTASSKHSGVVCSMVSRSRSWPVSFDSVKIFDQLSYSTSILDECPKVHEYGVSHNVPLNIRVTSAVPTSTQEFEATW